MFLRNLMPRYDFKSLYHTHAALLAEILKKHKEAMAPFFLLQNAEAEDRLLLKELKIRGLDEFFTAKDMLYDLLQEPPSLEFNQLTQNEPTDQLMDRHVLNARTLWHFLTTHPDIVNNLLPSSMFDSDEATYKVTEMEKQQWHALLPKKDIQVLLSHLYTSSFAELHYSVKGLKNIGRIIKEGLLICRELRLSIESLRKEYDAMEQQTESEVKALDSWIRILQRDFAELMERFTDSILKITSKGLENYEDTMKQSEIRQEHMKTVLTLAEERVDDEIKAIQKEVKDTWSRKYKLESAMESQIASYDEEMIALQALWIEHEEMLTQEEAERERQRAADAHDAAVTEACRVISAYARAFLARRAATTATTSHRRRRERR